jgi:DNA repair protein RadD
MVKCPNCRHMHPAMPSCPHCGHEYPKRMTVEHVPGTLKELIASGTADQQRKHLWPMVCGYVLETTDDLARAQRKAQAIYHEITGKFAVAKIETTKPAPCSRELRNKIRANTIRWAKGRQSGGATA